jgi:NAD(P)-dependent dehydrogenase (short-subunit alcohol dehydrogenase family)
MSRMLTDKVAIITGGATGIGEAIAHKFAQLEAKVVVAGLPTDPLDDVVRVINDAGGDAVAFKGDLSDVGNAEACIALAIEKFKKIDVLVNNAGVFLVTAPVEKYPLDVYEQTIKANITSAFLMTRFAMPYLQATRGVVLFTGSESGIMGLGNNAVYGGTKAWLHSFAKGVAVEQAAHGVRANCVCPGPIDTAWTHKETGPMTGKMEESLIAGTLMGRRGTPEEVANVFAFLASDEASYVTAALWSVDGGTTSAKGPLGDLVPKDLREEPEGELSLHHSKHGLDNKETRSLM